MSSAARDAPRSADDLPPLTLAALMVSEAPPDPPVGPVRDGLAGKAAARTDRAVALMEAALRAYNERLEGVVAARLRSPKTRKGTRWWTPEAGAVAVKSRVEIKSLDASYVLPERVVRDELYAALRPVGLRIVSDSAADVARQLGRRPNMGLAAFSWDAVGASVDSAVERMLEINERHARDVRREILGADATAETLDAAIDRVLEATRRGGKWLLIAGRTLATALAGDAALGAAKALGVTHTAWISRRDPRVRESHAEADGQVRPVGEKFLVGGFRLRFPGDPSGLPASSPVVHGCRCGLTFMPPDAEHSKAVRLAQNGAPGPSRALLSAARRSGTAQMTEGAPDLGAPAILPEVEVPEDVVGYRTLDEMAPVTPGQRISWPGPLALALAPAAADALSLAVVLPAGTAVGVGAGGAVLGAASQLEVLAVTAEQVIARPV